MFNRANIGFNRTARWNQIVPFVKHYSTFLIVYIRTKLRINVDIRG